MYFFGFHTVPGAKRSVIPGDASLALTKGSSVKALTPACLGQKRGRHRVSCNHLAEVTALPQDFGQRTGAPFCPGGDCSDTAGHPWCVPAKYLALYDGPIETWKSMEQRVEL